MTPDYRRTKAACYYSYLSMSSVFCLPAMLLATFHSMYGISYTLLGTLVLINFATQLCIDLIFTFFSKRFNIALTVRIMPLLTAAGLALYALLPTLFPARAFLGLAAGTVLFSLSAGLSEVLLSPMIAALPSENPAKDMSLLHSLYAWGLVLMVGITTLYLNLFGSAHWQVLAWILAALPLGASLLFWISPIPEISGEAQQGAGPKSGTAPGIALCLGCIFWGSASENVMTNWISGFLENALSISKSVCDVVGLAVFSVLLGLARVLNAKYGKKIVVTLFAGAAGAVACYLVAGLSQNRYLAAAACALAGFCTAMLWPGTLILMEENMPGLGVAAYALMAAGGDCGAAIMPQLMGVITDRVAAGTRAQQLGSRLSITAEQVGLKTGMVISALWPMLCAVFVLLAGRYFARRRKGGGLNGKNC